MAAPDERSMHFSGDASESLASDSLRPGIAVPAEGGDEDEDRPSYGAELRESIVELWRFREMLYQLTLRDIRIRYKQAVIGFGWAIVMPALVVLSGCLLRLAMSQATGSRLDLSSVATLAVKALPWSFFIGTLGAATASLTGNLQLVTKVYFPRATLPLGATLGQLFDAAIGAGVLLVVLPFLGVRPSVELLWVPVLAAILVLLTVAASLFLSCANLFFRDVKYIVQLYLIFGIFFTPVFFEPFAMGARIGRIIMLNPLSVILEGLRLAIVERHDLLVPLFSPAGVQLWSPGYLAYAGIWAAGGVALSAAIFHRAEFVFAEYV
jgi:lipopolysaccharide transport system permease protein